MLTITDSPCNDLALTGIATGLSSNSIVSVELFNNGSTTYPWTISIPLFTVALPYDVDCGYFNYEAVFADNLTSLFKTTDPSDAAFTADPTADFAVYFDNFTRELVVQMPID